MPVTRTLTTASRTVSNLESSLGWPQTLRRAVVHRGRSRTAGSDDPTASGTYGLRRSLDREAARISVRTTGVCFAMVAEAGSSADLAPWLRDATINTDRNLRLQYLAGLTLNATDGGGIYRDMLRHARFPDAIFAGSPAVLGALRERIARRLAQAR